MKSWSVNSKEGCLLTATGQEAWSEGWQRKPSSVATTFSTEDVSAIVKDRIALRGKSMLENCAVMKRRIVCERSTTTLVGVMCLHRNSSIWPEMGKAGVQGSSSPKRCLEKDPKNCSTVRGQGMQGWLPVVEELGIHPSVRATEQHQLRQEDSCYFKHLGLVQWPPSAGGQKSPHSRMNLFQTNMPTLCCVHTGILFSMNPCGEACQQ